MVAAIFHLTNTDNYPRRYAIEQGATFEWLSLILSGNYSDWIPSGQIRSNYASRGGVVKANFGFESLSYAPVELPSGSLLTGTLVVPKLSVAQTMNLDWAETKMIDRKLGEAAIPGKNVWVYDVELTSPDAKVMRVMQGFVEVSLEATAVI